MNAALAAAAAASDADGAGANSPWGWLGLLKWSLAYSDGTSPTKASPMTDEDKAFLEKVMKEGIIDENERMKEILKVVTEGLDDVKSSSEQSENNMNNDTNQEMVDEIGDLLQELRDIVEQIDYARAFMAMKGLPFLLGCISQQEVPKSIRMSCLGVLATMASNNPPIQKELLEMGAIKTLSEVFQSTPTEDAAFRGKVIQALGGAVRSDEMAEQVFCAVDQARDIIMEGLHGAEVLQKRTLFFLRALITSDDSNRDRVRLFSHAIAFVADKLVCVNPSDNDTPTGNEIREMALELVVQILQDRKSVDVVLSRKDALVAHGVQRVSKLRALTGEDREYASVELESWENLLVQLARATPDADETPLMIGGANPEVVPQ